MTPFEAMNHIKPDFSHLRVWGCQCFPAIPPELHVKAGSQRYEAIFVGYEENQIGWRVCDLKGRYHFLQDVIFNESVSGHLSPHCSISVDLNTFHLLQSFPMIIHNQVLSIIIHTLLLLLFQFQLFLILYRTVILSLMTNTNALLNLLPAHFLHNDLTTTILKLSTCLF
jgi:hypothetical protein